MRPVILKIVLTLTCLVAPALLGVGDRAVAGVMTMDKVSACGNEPMVSLSAGAGCDWDLFSRLTDRFFECTITATERATDDDARPGSGLHKILAKTLIAVGRPSNSDAGGTRSIEQDTDSIDGMLVSGSACAVLARHRQRHHSDKLPPNPVVSDQGQPPRW